MGLYFLKKAKEKRNYGMRCLNFCMGSAPDVSNTHYYHPHYAITINTYKRIK